MTVLQSHEYTHIVAYSHPGEAIENTFSLPGAIVCFTFNQFQTWELPIDCWPQNSTSCLAQGQRNELMRLNRTLLIHIFIFLAGWEIEKNTRLATTPLCHTHKTNFLATAIQGKFWLITTWVLFWVCFAICNGEVLLTKAIARIWELGDIVKTKSTKTKHKWPDDQTGCKQTSALLLIFIAANW